MMAGAVHAQTTVGTGASFQTYTVPALSPLTIFQGDLVAWYSCDVGITTSGSGVTAWSDRSLYGHNLSAISGNFAFSNTSFNGHCGLTSTDTGTNFLLRTSAFNINHLSASLFIVASISGCAGGSAFFGYTNGSLTDGAGFTVRGNAGGNRLTWFQANYSGDPFFPPTSLTFNTGYRIGLVNNGTAVTSFLNNVVQNNGAFGGDEIASGYNILGTNSETFHLGGLTDGDFPCGFTTPEVLMTRSVATTAQRVSLDSYFRTKWGL